MKNLLLSVVGLAIGINVYGQASRQNYINLENDALLIKSKTSTLKYTSGMVNTLRKYESGTEKATWGDICLLPAATDLCNRELTKISQEQQLEMYKTYSNLATSSLTALNDIIKTLPADIRDSQAELMSTLSGYRTSYFEGFKRCYEKSDLKRDIFYGKISDTFDKYFDYEAEDTDNPVFDDYILQNGCEFLYNRIAERESFIEKYPDFPLNESLRVTVGGYIWAFLIGLNDATPFTDGILDVDMQILMEQIITRNDGLKITASVIKYYNALKKNNFKEPENLFEFAFDNGVFEGLDEYIDIK